MRADREIDVLAAGVHAAAAALHASRITGNIGPRRRGALDVLHGLGYLYNVLRGGALDADALMHASWFLRGGEDQPLTDLAFVLFDGASAVTHARRALEIR